METIRWLKFVNYLSKVIYFKKIKPEILKIISSNCKLLNEEFIDLQNMSLTRTMQSCGGFDEKCKNQNMKITGQEQLNFIKDSIKVAAEGHMDDWKYSKDTIIDCGKNAIKILEFLEKLETEFDLKNKTEK